MLTPEQRKKALKKVWSATHKDFRGTYNGIKTIMVYRNGTMIVNLDALTDAEIMEKLPRDYMI